MSRIKLSITDLHSTSLKSGTWWSLRKVSQTLWSIECMSSQKTSSMQTMRGMSQRFSTSLMRPMYWTLHMWTKLIFLALSSVPISSSTSTTNMLTTTTKPQASMLRSNLHQSLYFSSLFTGLFATTLGNNSTENLSLKLSQLMKRYRLRRVCCPNQGKSLTQDSKRRCNSRKFTSNSTRSSNWSF